jgi:hypothetical protein
MRITRFGTGRLGLGVLGNIDSDQIRESLAGLLEDPDENVREEAMVGLGKRKDQRVLRMLMARLEQPEISVRVIETAHLMLEMDKEREDWNGRLRCCPAVTFLSVTLAYDLRPDFFPHLLGMEFCP